MLQELVKNKVYYKIFDKTCNNLTHKYTIHNSEDLEHAKQVKNNIGIILKELNADNLFLLKQIHGNDVVLYDNNMFVANLLTEGDASTTSIKNIALGIRTADCAPILVTNITGTIIGAAHCGWRSAKLGIVQKLARIMQQKTDDNLIGIIGPSIAQESYEVSNEFYQNFINDSESNKTFFIDSINKNYYMFDLPGFVKLKFKESNISLINHVNEDTYKLYNKYPSYRRSKNTGEIYCESILSTILIR